MDDAFPEQFDLYEDDDINYKNMEKHDLISQLRTAQQWIADIGQPAMQTVDILQSRIDEYEMERNDNKSELKIVHKQLSEDINCLKEKEIATNYLLNVNNSLRLEMRDSTKR